jgi:hypothetical protein
VTTLLALLVVGFAAFFILGTIALVGFFLKLLFWVVLFPIRLALKLVFGIVGFGLAALIAPVVFLVAAVAVIGAILAAIVALLAPLVPLLLVGLVGWLIYRASTNHRTYEPTNPRTY